MKIKIINTTLALSTLASSLGAFSFTLHAHPTKFFIPPAKQMNPQVEPESLEDYLKILAHRKNSGNPSIKLTEKELDAEVAKALEMAEKNMSDDVKNQLKIMNNSPEIQKMFMDMVRESLENPGSFFGIQSYSKENKKSCSDMIMLGTSVPIKRVALHVLKEAQKHNHDTVEVTVDGEKIQVVVGADNIQKALDALNQ